ncbi:MAG: ankyrin repeat domain-containing protein [Armatimonadota bacterium]
MHRYRAIFEAGDVEAPEGAQQMNARLLLDGGADPNLVDCTGTTALLAAAAEGHTQIVRDLLERGADPRARDSDGATARMLAERHICELRSLLRASADRAP